MTSLTKSLFILAATLLISSTTLAEIVKLSDITMPDDVENVYVKKLSSDPHSTDFVIFIKKQVALHKHLSHTETVYVLAGRGLFQLGEEKYEIGPGDYMRIPEKMPHAVTVLSEEPLKVLSVQAPEFFGKDRVFIEATDIEINNTETTE